MERPKGRNGAKADSAEVLGGNQNCPQSSEAIGVSESISHDYQPKVRAKCVVDHNGARCTHYPASQASNAVQEPNPFGIRKEPAGTNETTLNCPSCRWPHHPGQDCPEMPNNAPAQTPQGNQLMEALRFYADPKNWAHENYEGTDALIWGDEGKRAREALDG